MRDLLDFICIIQRELKEFNSVIVTVRDYRGDIHHLLFSKDQDIVRKCIFMANSIGDDHRVISMKCRY